MENNQDEFENISRETLIDLLKKQSKEMKLIQTKLIKIEEKYKNIFKENKLLQKDREIFVQFLQYLSETIQVQPLGEFDLKQIQKSWDNIYNLEVKEFEKQLNQIRIENQNLNQIIKEMEQGVSQKYQKQNDQQSEQILLKEQQIIDLNNQLQESDQQLSKKDEIIVQLKQIEFDYSLQKSQLLLQELKINYESLNQQSEQKQNDLNNKLLLTKSLLEDANLKICELQSQIDPINHKYPQFIKDNKYCEVFTQTFQFDCQQCKNYQNEQINQLNQNPKERLNIDYLRQVVLRFICFTESKNFSQAKVLLNVIITILQFDSVQINLIDQAKNQGNLWNNAKSFFKESIVQFNDQEKTKNDLYK